jgi:hypothetical protein
MTTRNVTERIGPWVEAAIDTYGEGDVAGWCCVPVPAPLPVVIGLALMLWIPSAHELGTHLVGQRLFESPPTLDEAAVTSGVRELLAGLREARSKGLRRSQASQNGRPPISGPGELRLGPGPPQGLTGSP